MSSGTLEDTMHHLCMINIDLSALLWPSVV